MFEGVVERIMPGAFDRSIRESSDARIPFNHYSDFVLGRTSAGTLLLSKDFRELRHDIDAPDNYSVNVEGFRTTDEKNVFRFSTAF